MSKRPLDYNRCARPGCEQQEGRIDNYCSVYCRDVDEAELEIEAWQEAFRAMYHHRYNAACPECKIIIDRLAEQTLEPRIDLEKLLQRIAE